MTLLPQLIDNGQKARLAFTRGDELIYRTDDGFLFPVPLADARAAALKAEELALNLVRWIIRQLLKLNAAPGTVNAP